MKVKFIIIMIFIIGISSCARKQRIAERNSEVEKLMNEKKEFFEKVENQEFDYKFALQIADSYKRFLERFPDDELIPTFILELADITNNYLNDPKEAIHYYNMFLIRFPDHEDAPVAIFMIATLYHDKLKDLNKAKEYYERVIKQYPDHYFVKDAKIMLENLGKSPEELLEVILKKNKEGKTESSIDTII